MNLIDAFQKELVSLGFALVTAFVLWLFRARTKIVWATPHQWTFLLNTAATPSSAQGAGAVPVPAQVPATFNVHTGSIVVFNEGRLPATELEVTFNWMPQNFNIWPVRPFETATSADQRFTLKFSNLAPRELFQIEMISSVALPAILNVRSKECVGKQINMRPMIIYKPWITAMLGTMVFFGFASVIYVFIKLGTLLMSK